MTNYVIANGLWAVVYGKTVAMAVTVRLMALIPPALQPELMFKQWRQWVMMRIRLFKEVMGKGAMKIKPLAAP